jgi:uncharacterized membrane protein YgdD (TMEM256/DUF423 family)
MMEPAARRLLIIGALLLACATALGAWAAHGLDSLLDADSVATFRTGVEYHFYNALGLLGIGLLVERNGAQRLLVASGWLLIAGILMFSGSLYVLAFGMGRFLGPVTPIGGLSFIAAWCSLAISLWRGSPRTTSKHRD